MTAVGSLPRWGRAGAGACGGSKPTRHQDEPKRRAVRPVFLIAGLSATLLLAGCGHVAPSRAAHVATSYASRQLCGAAFISHVDTARYFEEAVAPRGGPLAPLFRYEVDLPHGEVRTTLLGLAESRATYRGALGCVTSTDATPPPVVLPTSTPAPALLAPIAGDAVVEPATPALQAALAQAFEESPTPPYRHTQAIVVVHHDRVLAERYAAGVGVETPLLGWSATKSVTNALLGILVRQGRLDMQAPAPVPAWRDPADPRHAITPDQLLRMTSGLDLGNSLGAGLLSAFDKSAQMTFLEADMGAYAERAPLQAPPGSRWQYADGNTLLLSRIIRDRVGGDAPSVLAFAHRELFDKLGMTHPVWEFDAAGTPVGASRLWATARDWARFGLLYLHDGVVSGERILPAGWAEYSATLTPGSEFAGYGAGFWTNRATTGGAARRRAAGMPDDAYFARGNDGQYVFVIPSRDVVIVRLGNSLGPDGDIAAVERLVTDVLANLPPAS